MSSSYPGALDNFITDKADASVSATDHHNDLADAINKIQAALGVDPAGGFPTLAARASGAFTPFGPDLVTGDSQHFTGGLGDWIEVGAGTIEWTEGIYAHAIAQQSGSSHHLNYSGAEVGDYLELPLSGTFEEGKRYIAAVALQYATDAEWSLFLGAPVGDSINADLLASSFNADPRVVSVLWTPGGDVVDPVVRLTYDAGPEGSCEVGFCFVAEVFDYPLLNGLAIVASDGDFLELGNHHLHMRVGEMHAKVDNDLRIDSEVFELRTLVDPIFLYADASDITLEAAQSINIEAVSNLNLSGGMVKIFDAFPGLSAATRPALQTAITETDVIAGYNLIRTMLISLGLATDGD